MNSTSKCFRHSTKEYVKEFEQDYIKDNYLERVADEFKSNPGKHPGALLLDSSLISPTHYDYKIIECGKYVQVYQYLNKKTSQKDKKEKTMIDYDYLFTKREFTYSHDKKYIELKNINRSKFQLQRIVKTNENKFKTFITLTFSENVKSIEEANKKFDIWRTKIKSIFKDFCYCGVPEFQKRGAVHYHLLTNLEIDKIYQYTRRGNITETKIIIPQKDFTIKQLQKMTSRQRQKCFDVKYWSYGFSSVYPLENINVVGYLTKYMTKDIDNRLWGKRKYLYSMNLNRPKEALIDSDKSNEYSKIFEVEMLYNQQYQKVYYDKLGDPILFTEFKLGE